MSYKRMYVKAEVSKGEAKHILSQRTSFFPIKVQRKSAPPIKIELMHLPFYFFEILLSGQAGKQDVTLSLDGLLGSTIFFTEKDLDFIDKVENPVCPFVLSQSDAQKKVLEEYKWQLLEHGLRTKKRTTVEELASIKEIFYPFWVGYFQRKKGYDFKAIDAVSGEFQGIKMRKTFLKAFRQLASI